MVDSPIHYVTPKLHKADNVEAPQRRILQSKIHLSVSKSRNRSSTTILNFDASEPTLSVLNLAKEQQALQAPTQLKVKYKPQRKK